MTGPSSNKLIVVHVAIVKSPALNRLTALFRMYNEKKGGADRMLSCDKQEVKCRDHSLDLIREKY